MLGKQTNRSTKVNFNWSWVHVWGNDYLISHYLKLFQEIEHGFMKIIDKWHFQTSRRIGINWFINELQIHEHDKTFIIIPCTFELEFQITWRSTIKDWLLMVTLFFGNILPISILEVPTKELPLYNRQHNWKAINYLPGTSFSTAKSLI